MLFFIDAEEFHAFINSLPNDASGFFIARNAETVREGEREKFWDSDPIPYSSQTHLQLSH